MESETSSYRWVIGKVSESEEHIKISFGSYDDSDAYQFIPVARLSAHKKGMFVVEFLIKYDTPHEKKMIDAVKRELDLYLLEVPLGHPWDYAVYHCSTSSNIYSHVHWAYFPDGSAAGQKGMHSEVVTEEKIDHEGKRTKKRIIYKPEIKV